MEHCPVCRARLRGKSELCRRCRSDISLLYEIEEQAGNLMAAAVRAWAAGELETAVNLARRSLDLKDDAEARIMFRFLSRKASEIGREVIRSGSGRKIPPPDGINND